jgi:hypothetical protein
VKAVLRVIAVWLGLTSLTPCLALVIVTVLLHLSPFQAAKFLVLCSMFVVLRRPRPACGAASVRTTGAGLRCRGGRLMRLHAWRARRAAIATSLGCVCCSPPPELPEVRTSLAWDVGCPARAYGVVARPAWIQLSDGSSLLECAIGEFGACRPGQIEYEIQVGRRGELLALSVTGEAPSVVRSCVADHLRDAVLTPAADCRDEAVSSTLSGDLRWNSEDGLRDSQSGVLGAAWPCAAGQR